MAATQPERESGWRRSLWFVSLTLIIFAGCGKQGSARIPANTRLDGAPGAPRAAWIRLPDAALEQGANAYIAKMSLDQQIGQLLMMEYTSEQYSGPGTDSQQMIQQLQPGATILYHSPQFGYDQLGSTQQALTFDNGSQNDSKIPLLVSTDQEGGPVDRLSGIYGPHPSAQDIGLTNNAQYAYNQGALTAKQMLALGINTDLGPVVDVESNRALYSGPDNQRAFGTTPDVVTKMAGAWLDGLQENGVIGTIKHFPGLGIARTDPHKSLPTIDRTVAQLNAIDLAPYKALLAGNDPPGMIMTTDLLLPAVDPTLPAELSPKIIDGLLRTQLGYQGVVVTDALYMEGVFVYAKYDLGVAGVMALQAGCDMLLGAAGYAQGKEMVDAIKQALQSGQLTMDRIQLSVRRILMLKIKRGLLPLMPPTTTAHAFAALGTAPVADLRPVDAA